MPVDATGRRLAVLVNLVEAGCAPDHGPGPHVTAASGELVEQEAVRRAPRDSAGKGQALHPATHGSTDQDRRQGGAAAGRKALEGRR